MATRIYKTPFAATGDKEALATADQPDGKVSLQAGWTPDYELPNDNANYRPVGRAEMNGIIGEITESLGDVQLHGFATWQAIDGGWPIGAHVLAGGVIYRSDADNNTTNPGTGGAGWSQPFAGRLLNVRVFNTPGTTTYTPTPGTNRRVIEVLGAGGQGGGVENDTVASTMATAAGGGAGAYGVLHITGPATSATVTVGAGGTGATTGTGVSGGSSSFGSLLTCAGGLGGQFGRSATIPTAGPTLPGGDGGGNPAGATVGFPGAAGMTGAYLNAGVTSGMGASSRYGAGGNSRSTSTPIAQAGNAGQGFGSGGSGAARVGVGSNQVGGAGAPGIVIVWEYS
ncbi:glycine-rich domain-containing protein [Achromobacter xylosoxidans]|uniref:glycine-rich domain-containing protein n=1 Tax=Alcaligenes xylosoxydans xylosoxydans TaxID=85698 RepID=UPI00105D56E0|nr:hypothetical protein [Achromobacter xylosoxidans]BEG74426.1 hypothetical protein HBIAX_01473 [Achromobacter xylosoxidans]